MKPTNNHDQALRALARSVQEAGERLVNLQRRIADGARMPAGTVSNAARVESFAREAFAITIGERVGSGPFSVLLGKYLSPPEGEPVESRTTLSEAAAVFEFVGRFDDYAESDRLTLNEIREAAHQFARDQRG